jgi:hypothetical protein
MLRSLKRKRPGRFQRVPPSYPTETVVGKNICEIECANVFAVRDKFKKLASGETTNLSHRPIRCRSKIQDSTLDINVYSKLTLDQAFSLIEGKCIA